MFILIFFIFLFGLIIGSFLNCVIYRLEEGIKLSGRSYCPKCKHQLKWLDLFPVFSYLFLRGRCRYCNKKISAEYPAVELATAAIFTGIFLFAYPNIPYLAFLLYIAASLIVIFVYDFKHYLILGTPLFLAIGVTVAYQLIFDYRFFLFNSLWAACLAVFFFLILFWISWFKEGEFGAWMAFGDVQLVALLGLLLGFPNILLGLFLSFFFGAIIGLISILLSLSIKNRTKVGLESQIPFAPFLIMGTFVAMFWGQQIIDWYLNLFII